MATGAYDANGIWQYGESDPIALFSDLLNIGMESTSDAFTDDRSRITFLEQSVEQSSTFVASSQAARDSYWGIPSTGTEQLALQNKGARTVRTDTGSTEQYFGVYNVSTNPGGRDAAGWYTIRRQDGLVPIKPATITAVTGSASVTALGQVSFSGVTKVSLDGVFSDTFRNYRIIVDLAGSTTVQHVILKPRIGTTDFSSSVYSGANILNQIGTSGAYVVNGTAEIRIGYTSNIGTFGAVVDLHAPFVTGPTRFNSMSAGTDNSYMQAVHGSGVATYNDSYTGLSLLPSGGTITGTITIYGLTGNN